MLLSLDEVCSSFDFLEGSDLTSRPGAHGFRFWLKVKLKKLEFHWLDLPQNLMSVNRILIGW